MDQIPVFRPLIGLSEKSAAIEALELGWLGMGSYVQEFEDAVASHCGLTPESDRHVVAVSTGHAALHLSLMMIGVGPGDEVITPSLNNVADFQAIRACGAEPVFCDIRDDTLCIDAQQIAELASKRTKAIIAMDYDLFLCDHAEIAEVSKTLNIPVLHDAAHSFDSSYSGEKTGNQHPYTIFSFDPVKTITCIDGGAIVVKGADQVRMLQEMRLIGMTQPVQSLYSNSRAWTYDVTSLGFRYHMSNLHASIGLAQLRQLSEIRESRRRACERYYGQLSTTEWISAPCGDFLTVTPFLYYIRVLNGRRDELRSHLRTLGIDTGIHWPPGHKFSYFANCRRGRLDVTESVADQILSLPLHSMMKDEEVDRVAEAIQKFE